MLRVATTKCRSYVERREMFQNHSGSVRGHWHQYGDGTRVYVVWTYNEPLYVYDETTHQWFGNEHRYSTTSSKHRSQCCPLGVSITWYAREAMREIAANGLVGAVRVKFREAA